MQRTLMGKLVAWKNNARRKPLVLNGARQVGKTWLLKEFGRLHFENVAYVSLDNDALARGYFDPDFDVARIIASLSLELNVDIEPDKTLIVLDEVQACPKAITSLKYFCENAPEYAVAAAGSLLGISATEGTGFPVGK
ncbi:MAG: AAA family ATPase, partial [Coriobacteriales bacterium]|nr:AAA family ATPase [Coriobacteriales bacterium]